MTQPLLVALFFISTNNHHHGLEAAPQDQSAPAEWGCHGKDIPRADETAVGTGARNTTDILAGCTEAGIAAKLADDYELNGYTDWFLPSITELHELYLNKDIVGGFASGYYWSSSENGSDFAWYKYFLDGFQGKVDKYVIIRVRAVRAF